MWYKSLLFILCPFLSLGQHAFSNWSQAVDTVRTKSISPKTDECFVYRTTAHDPDLEILIPKKAFFKLAKKHYNFLKRTGASVFFCKNGNIPPHVWFEKALQQLKAEQINLVDSNFMEQSNAQADLKLVFESLMSKGELIIKYKDDYISKYILSQIYPRQHRATMPKKYIPVHLYGNGGNSYFRLPGDETCFYQIEQVPIKN